MMIAAVFLAGIGFAISVMAGLLICFESRRAQKAESLLATSQIKHGKAIAALQEDQLKLAQQDIDQSALILTLAQHLGLSVSPRSGPSKDFVVPGPRTFQ